MAFPTYIPCDGDILFVKGIGYDHAAIVYLDRASATQKWMVYEAWINPRKAQAIPLRDWLDRWDKRIFRVSRASLSVYRPTLDLTLGMRDTMYGVAEDRLGTPYNWLANFAFKLTWFDHCVEYIVWQLIEIGVSFKWEPSRVSPKRLRPVLLQSGLYTFYDHEVAGVVVTTGAPLIQPRTRWRRHRGYPWCQAWDN